MIDRRCRRQDHRLLRSRASPGHTRITAPGNAQDRSSVRGRRAPQRRARRGRPEEQGVAPFARGPSSRPSQGTEDQRAPSPRSIAERYARRRLRPPEADACTEKEHIEQCRQGQDDQRPVADPSKCPLQARCRHARHCVRPALGRPSICRRFAPPRQPRMPGREPEPHHAATLNAAGCRVRLRSERPVRAERQRRACHGHGRLEDRRRGRVRGDTMLVQTRRFAMTTSASPVLGRPLWFELMTTDTKAAEAFYEKVVGWTSAPFDGSPQPYTLFKRERRRAGRRPDDDGRTGMNMPPFWAMYVARAEARGRGARTSSASAAASCSPSHRRAHRRPHADAEGSAGRRVLHHPAGAERRSRPTRRPQVGEASWLELMTTDAPAAMKFYQRDLRLAAERGDGHGRRWASTRCSIARTA